MHTMNLWDTPLVYVDIETNGGNGQRGRIIEVAAIKVQDDEIIDTFTTLINPGMSILRPTLETSLNS